MDNTAMNQTHHMKPIAAGLAGLGRGGDSMLVHMQPREVAGLQRLAMAHGGSLTTNPETGLPEASFLGDVLGAVAPIALGAFLGPGAFGIQGLGLTSLQAGLATGALGFALTGDLGKGLMAGLGGYGGANLAGSLGAKGVTALTPQVTPVGASVAPDALSLADKLGVASAPVGEMSSVGGATTSLADKMGVGVIPPAYSTQATMAGLKDVLANPFAKGNLMDTATLASPLLAAATTTPQTTFPTVQEEKSNYEGPYYPTQRDARFPTQEERQQLGTKEYQYFTPTHPYPGYENYDPNYRGYAEGGDVNETPDPGSDPRQDAQEAMQYGIGGIARFADGGNTAEKNYGLASAAGNFKDPNSIPSAAFQADLDAYNKRVKDLRGGPVDNAQFPNSFFAMANPGIFRLFNGLTQAQAEAKAGPKPVWQAPPATTAPSAPPPEAMANPNFSGTGITALPQRQPTQNLNLTGGFSDMSRDIINSGGAFAKGGYLDGPGDGMSDSISATIADKQPARLADGEFVVPADVVSHLGNGSTKAGAQRLYAMMDKVRKARTGTTKQGKQINPNKYMPA